MRVQSITVNCYRSFGEKQNMLQVNPGVTTIVGMNGSGKSNLVDIIGHINLVDGTNELQKAAFRNRNLDKPISIIIKLQPSNDDEIDVVGDSPSEITLSENNGYVLSGGIAHILSELAESYDIYSALDAGNYPNANEKPGVMKHAKDIKSFSSIPLSNYKRTALSLKASVERRIADETEKENALEYTNKLIDSIDSIISCIPIFFFHDSTRQLKNAYSSDEINHVNANNSNQNTSLDNKPTDLFHSLIDLAGIARDDIIKAINNPTSSNRTMFEKQANKKLEEVMKGFRAFYKRGTENLSMEFRIDGSTLNIMIDSGETTTTLSERSNGLRWYLKMYIDMMKRVGMERPIVYVMDEPGIYLHINAQDELRQLLMEKSTESQIIYTTHSPYMIDKNFGCLRSITKTENDGFSFIQNSLYSSTYSHHNSLDTLSPIAAALGMDIRLTPGLSPQKLNVIVEGITDQIYLQAMIKKLDFDDSKFHIIPSTGAENIKHLCSILLGWGFRFVALFDYDNEGKKCCKELEKELRLRYMSGFMMLKKISAAEYDALQKIDADSAVVIESLISEEDRRNYGIQDHVIDAQKKINAVRFADAISKDGQITKETVESFLNVLQAIEAYANMEEEGVPLC